LNRPKHSPVIYDKDHPIGFKSKIKLLKRWFNQHPALAHRKIEFRGLAPRFLRLNGIRNEFLHSFLSDYDPNTKMAVWRGIKPEGAETYKVAMYQGTVDNLILFAAEAHQAHIDFAKIGRDLFESGMIEQLQKHVPRIPRPARRSLRLRGGLVFGRPR